MRRKTAERAKAIGKSAEIRGETIGIPWDLTIKNRDWIFFGGVVRFKQFNHIDFMGFNEISPTRIGM